MKLSAFRFGALLLAVILFANCKKDKTFEELLIGKWGSTLVKVGDADLTAINTFHLNLENSKEFDLDYITSISGSSTTVTSIGIWAQDDIRQDVTLTYDGSGDQVTYDVKEISESAMLVEYYQNKTRYQIQFIKE